MSKCKSCAAEIKWAVTPNGKRIPLDAAPNERGNITIEDGYAIVHHKWIPTPLPGIGELGAVYMPHHATCPNWKDNK